MCTVIGAQPNTLHQLLLLANRFNFEKIESDVAGVVVLEFKGASAAPSGQPVALNASVAQGHAPQVDVSQPQVIGCVMTPSTC